MNLSVSSTDDLSERVLAVKAEHAARYPGADEGRQPVHTFYVPADRVSATTPADLGAEALRLLDAHAPDAATFGEVFGLAPEPASRVRERVAAKLAKEPVEDLRIDFEDGYGTRPDGEEDAHVAQAVDAVAQAYPVRGLPHYWGLRVKSFADGGHERAMRTLDAFLTGLRDTLGRLPSGFIVTFPKVVMAEHVAVFTDFCARLEEALGLPSGRIRFEIQVETTEAIINGDGKCGLPAIVAAAAGRLTAAHFGVFDYTAACGLPPGEQRLDHPACDFARHVMQVSLAGTGVRLADGGTNVVPATDEAADVHHAWSVHARMVEHSLRHGFYQGWDVHAAQLPSRYAAVYGHYLDGVEEAARRVTAWRKRSAGKDGVVDEPATIKALEAHLRRAVDCGALDESTLPVTWPG
ncbi:MAG TPA: aldolase [Streptosporangiaceae bacterium]|nr:aldolase [Streptosporangiaceae bacterium]